MEHNPDNRRRLLLFICGFSILFWELALIRWLGANIRIVAYFTNFVLIAAFFGLGVGALLARFSWKLERLLAPAVCITVLMGLYLAGWADTLLPGDSEHIWFGAPPGVDPIEYDFGVPRYLRWGLLSLVYLMTVATFALFGQRLGRLFQGPRPLEAYSLEIAGSVCGILGFALCSKYQLTPTVWFAIGFATLFPLLDKRRLTLAVASLSTVAAIALTYSVAHDFTWSPYYKMQVEPLTQITDSDTGNRIGFSRPQGHHLTVNNDFHQMMLNLGADAPAHDFFREWRSLYEAPYRNLDSIPEGPILIVGAGTGNDVAAALRKTDREIFAVEIDPAILQLGRELHIEQPYSDPRVHVINDDARSFFTLTDRRFALVVFGFLDSHTLLSGFSSLRLDNFVYTRESLQQVKKLLLPGGEMYLTFTTNKLWQHYRFVKLIDGVFESPTRQLHAQKYTNGIVYSNKRREAGDGASLPGSESWEIRVPTDDWPFLYLKNSRVPEHYLVFIFLVVILGFASLLVLPEGQRTVRLPYFFLGAGFFLLETSNVVNLSLLFGSTWMVNVLVFSGILVLILFGNLTAYLWRRPPLGGVLAFLVLNIVIAYLTPTHVLLEFESAWLRGILAVVVFLGPVYFASLIFAVLIKNEPRLYQAYGSNLLGAVIGGASEYISLVVGFKLLLPLALIFYLSAYLVLRRTFAADVGSLEAAASTP